MLTVALTKADRVDEARVDEVERQVKEVLREYGFAEAKLFITAATEGRGIDALREHLLQLPGREHASQHSFRLAIDRAFTVKGAGLVVTGTALSGEVKVGDSLWLTGVNKPMRVRALHAQNQPTETAHAGQRIALNIAGDAEKEQINRGDWLLADVPPEKRTARFVSVITCVFPNGDVVTGKGACEGVIADRVRGEGGFGYDPLFVVGEKSFAEMTPAEKDAVSHRGHALTAFAAELRAYLSAQNKGDTIC